jgi:hypothetical protein
VHALRPIVDKLAGGQARRGEAAPQLSQLLLRNLNPERADPIAHGAAARYDRWSIGT